jgi:hypothetical protein
MNVAKTIPLAVAVLVLGGYAFLDHTGTLKKWFDKPPVELLRPNLEQLTGFSITNPNGALRITRDGDDWRLAEPLDDKADFEWAINTMNTLGQMAVAKVMEDSANDTGLGFNPNESTTVSIQYGDAAGPRYLIGGNGPTKETTYVKSREGVFLVVGELDDVRTITGEELIDPVLTRFDPVLMRAIDLKQGEQASIELARKKTVQPWLMKKPFTHSADDEKVNRWLNQWAAIDLLGVTQRAKADSVMPKSGPDVHSIKLWEDDPQKVITIQLRKNPEDASKAYVRVSDRALVYETSSSVLETVPEDPKTLRESRLLRVMAADIDRMAIAMPGSEPVRVQQDGTSWSFVRKNKDDPMEMVNPEQPDRLFKLLNETRVTQYITEEVSDLTRFGLAEPYMTLQLEGIDLGPAEVPRMVMNVGYPLVPGEAPLPLAFVSFEGLPFVAGVDKNFLTSMSKFTSPLRWKKLGVLDIGYASLREVAITQADGNVLSVNMNLLSEDAGERIRAFQGEKEVTANLDMNAASAFINLLGGLSVDQWLTPRQDVSDALLRPTVMLNVSAKGKAGDDVLDRWTMQFAPTVRGAKKPSFYYGQMESNPNPFLIKAEVYDRLSGKYLLSK